MKKIENNFVVTGFVGNNAEIRQFTNASVARFSLAVSRHKQWRGNQQSICFHEHGGMAQE